MRGVPVNEERLICIRLLELASRKTFFDLVEKQKATYQCSEKGCHGRSLTELVEDEGRTLTAHHITRLKPKTP